MPAAIEEITHAWDGISACVQYLRRVFQAGFLHVHDGEEDVSFGGLGNWATATFHASQEAERYANLPEL